MKKLAFFFLIIIIIIVIALYNYMIYKNNYNAMKRHNREYEYFLDKEINGYELISLVNKAIDNNTSKEVAQDSQKKYIDNGTDSINIDIKMIDNDKTYNMEQFYYNGINNFVMYYGEIKFKCTKLEYHNTTKKVKYMLFEQITQ